MDKTNLELFKEALREGLSDKIDSTVDSYNGETTHSDKHDIAMRTILQGKLPKKKRSSHKLKRVIAVIAILTLLLVSCGIVYRDEIKALKQKISPIYDWLTYSEEDTDDKFIEEVYELTYLPEGYFLNDSYISSNTVVYWYSDAKGTPITFNQNPLYNLHIMVDNEEEYKTTIQIDNYTIHHRQVKDRYMYLWNDGKYAFSLDTGVLFSDEELRMILQGIKIK